MSKKKRKKKARITNRQAKIRQKKKKIGTGILYLTLAAV